MSGYCFDTDILSATIRPAPPRRVGREELSARVEQVIRHAQTVLPFDTLAARTFGVVKAILERNGTPLAEPDLRIASIALTRGLIPRDPQCAALPACS